MARQFREQLEEEVQLEEARKAQRAASPPPVEVPTATEPRAESAGSSAAAPHAPANGGSELTPEASRAHEVKSNDPAQPRDHVEAADHIQTADAPGDDPTGRPAQAGGADERRT
jgi:hypothetical protein